MTKDRHKHVKEEMDNTDEEEAVKVTEVTIEALDQEQVSALQKEIDDLRSKSEEYLQGWQRERAEFTNFKRRVEREREQIHQNAAGTIIRRYLEVLDDLERALKNRPRDGDGAVWADGIELIYRKLLAALEAEGVQPMDAQGQQFDPNLHEAISNELSSDHDSGQIIEVIKNGYLIGERVLRPALVRVAQ